MSIEKIPTTYIMANRYKGTVYIGVTSDLMGRVFQHKNSMVEGFTKDYGCKTLVYYEVHTTMEQAIIREKKLKILLRQKKIDLIEKLNPHWEDLYESLCL